MAGSSPTIERRRDDSLVGQLEEVSMQYIRNNIGMVLTQVQMGKVFVLVHGKTERRVAVLSRPPGENLTIEVGPTGELSYSL